MHHDSFAHLDVLKSRLDKHSSLSGRHRQDFQARHESGTHAGRISDCHHPG